MHKDEIQLQHSVVVVLIEYIDLMHKDEIQLQHSNVVLTLVFSCIRMRYNFYNIVLLLYWL